MHYLFLQNNVFERLEAIEAEMEQPYWAGIHESLTDEIHAGLTKSTEGSFQHPTKKKPKFSSITQIRIPIPQPYPPIHYHHPPGHRRSPPPPTTSSTLLFDSPPRSLPPPSPFPPPSIADDLQYESVELQMSISPPYYPHCTPPTPGVAMLALQAIPLI